MTGTRERAFAKLNLTLDVLGKRTDGYHDLRMVMQSVALCDEVTLSPRQDGALYARCNFPFLPTGDGNLAVIAARRFWAALGREPVGMDITIHKQIPVCAGLAGGSSDAAAVLRALNGMQGGPFAPAALAEIGAGVGSDVPYCVLGGTALAEGRGERITPLPSLPFCHVVVCKPDFPISTPELFGRIDSVKLRCRPDTGGMLAALEVGDLAGVARRLYNVFEDALTERHRDKVTQIKSVLIQQGALGACMSGSGPTVFGLFDDLDSARTAYEELRGAYPDTFLTYTV